MTCFLLTVLLTFVVTTGIYISLLVLGFRRVAGRLHPEFVKSLTQTLVPLLGIWRDSEKKKSERLKTKGSRADVIINEEDNCRDED